MSYTISIVFLVPLNSPINHFFSDIKYLPYVYQKGIVVYGVYNMS
jgi:hypothetical protein